jgi:hypothetical protein
MVIRPVRIIHPAKANTWVKQMFRKLNPSGVLRVNARNPPAMEPSMPESRSSASDFNRAIGDAKKNAAGVANEVSDAAQDIYGQAADSAAQVADATTKAARKTAGSFEKALRNTIETQPYTAVVIALGLGWLFGRMHRPL